MALFDFGNYPERPGRPSPAFGAPAETPAFGVNSPQDGDAGPEAHSQKIPNPGRVISEPILALKIYDSCRHKICLGHSELGPARAADGVEPIVPPAGAGFAHIENLVVRRITIASKTPSPFRSGFWDMEIRYVFDYDLRFTATDGAPLNVVRATNSFTRRCSLFGSVGAEITIATDIFNNAETIMGGEPFVMVEAKAIGLAAEIVRKHRHVDASFVNVTIGLFSITKLYRLVSLLVESRGFVIPPPCGEICPPDPCDVFDGLNFPMDSFAPPQRAEFAAGISGDIPNVTAAALTDSEEASE